MISPGLAPWIRAEGVRPRQLRMCSARTVTSLPERSLRRRRPPFRKGKGRLDLARAICDPANPLTARVMVIGCGRALRRRPGPDPGDLGTRGAEPSHPDCSTGWRGSSCQGWSLQEAAPPHPAVGDLPAIEPGQPNCDGDPENRLLWRMSVRRLSFENSAISLAGDAGRLDDTTRAGRLI